MQDHKVAQPPRLTILGGGFAGLSVGYYAKKMGIPFTLYEENEVTGGNCITYRHGDFMFDSGAHRFLDEYPEVTEEIKSLLGDELKPISIPSKIYEGGKFIDIPFKPLNLFSHLGAGAFLSAAAQVLGNRLKPLKSFENFERFATWTYGPIIASRFLLNYSEKLWGRPASTLSAVISGKRLKGLSLWNFIVESILGPLIKSVHREGAFYYPEGGIHRISKKMEGFCGTENVRVISKITSVLHDDLRIKAIEVNEKERIEVDQVASTIPIDYFVRIMNPPPPDSVFHIARSLTFRHLRLAVFFLQKGSVMPVATLYVPDRGFSFTRLYEPRNRNPGMSPPGKTSLAAEIPCENGDELWNMSETGLIEKIKGELIRTGLLREEEIIDAISKRIPNAYPLLMTGTQAQVSEIISFLKKFENLKLSGRNGRFEYTWIHDMIRSGKKIVENYIERQE